LTHPTDAELLAWKAPSEDHFVERKVSSDTKDWAKTVVAFANSAPFERHGVLYIGVRDDGSIELGLNADSLQKNLNEKLKSIYPPVEYTTRVLSEGTQEFLCVVVPRSQRGPHFSGPAYVRVGSQTQKASEQQFDRLIAERNSQCYQILKHLGSNVCVAHIRSESPDLLGRVSGTTHLQVAGCTQSAVTLRAHDGTTQAIGLERVKVVEDVVSGSITLEVRAN